MSCIWKTADNDTGGQASCQRTIFSGDHGRGIQCKFLFLHYSVCCNCNMLRAQRAMPINTEAHPP
eukprot:3828294-Amphidinium_carterae.2